MSPLHEGLEQAIDEMRRDGAELKSQVFQLRTDVARSSSSLKKATVVTGISVVLAIVLGLTRFGPGLSSNTDGPHEAAKSEPVNSNDKSVAPLSAEIEDLRTAVKELNRRLDSQAARPAEKAMPAVAAKPAEVAKPAGKPDCAGLPADINASAVDFSIQFEVGSAKIPSASEATLDSIAKILALAPDRCFLIEGYADSTGKSEKNMALSRDRADAVVSYIAGKPGVDRKSLVPVGKGSVSPAPGLDPGAPQNRRVIFKIVTG